jgi:methionyl-tRNA formyltransferase
MAETVVFFGSGPVAAKSLTLLLEHTAVEAVITKPTTQHEMAAAAPGVPQYLASTRKELDELIAAQRFTSRTGVLIDFGIIISQTVINSFPLGVVNSHFSILPEWRGADPISFAILSGQGMTGVSLMLLVERMDEGPILAYGEQPLGGAETTPELTKKLIYLSDSLLRTMLPKYFAGEAKPASQDLSGRTVSYSRKLTKEDGLLDWHKPAVQLEREIRAFIEWPKSRTVLADKDVVFTSAAVSNKSGQPSAITIENKRLFIACEQGSLEILQLKPAGKQEMTAEAFLAGYGSRL